MPRFSPKSAAYTLPPVTTSSDPVRARDIWTDRGTESLVVGDVVLVTDLVEVQLRVGDRVATRWGGRRAPEKLQHEGMAVKRRCLRRTVSLIIDARQVHVGRSAETHRTLKMCVMWSDAEIDTEGYPIGKKLDLGQGAIGRNRLKRVERLVGSGPKVRADDAGRTMLMDRLIAACGPDTVAGLARLVDPRTVQGGDPITLGITAAEMILDGSSPIRAWMLGQAEGRMPIPEADDTDTRHDREHAAFVDDYQDDDFED